MNIPSFFTIVAGTFTGFLLSNVYRNQIYSEIRQKIQIEDQEKKTADLAKSVEKLTEVVDRFAAGYIDIETKRGFVTRK